MKLGVILWENWGNFMGIWGGNFMGIWGGNFMGIWGQILWEIWGQILWETWGDNINPQRVKLVAYFRIMACACGYLYKPLTFPGFIGLSETSAIVTVQ